MISFIVIGLNEEKFLEDCFNSILETIKQNIIQKWEIIYVDSGSVDRSLEIAFSNPYIRTYQLYGECNAAVGRNVGAANANGDILFFIDGDMEIVPEFIPVVFTKKFRLNYKFVSGQFMNILYNTKGEFIANKKYYSSLNNDRYESTTGGLMIVEKRLWEKIGGMRTKYRQGEDLDFGLRLSKEGYRLLRKKELMAKHHTIDYMDNRRLWRDLLKGNIMYSRGMLYRDHILNKFIFKRIIKSDGSSIMLIGLIIIAIFTNIPWVISFYFIVLGIIVIFFKKPVTLNDIVPRIAYYFIRDILTIISFFMFFPSSYSNFKVVNNNKNG
jgi:glycosyltransferase involved in cell wall biosynthesis